jgi:glycerol-3-phosphate dehydrogenase subunit B
LAEGGLRTTLVAQGVGSTHLSPAVVDVLGYSPDLVESPAEALPGFVADHPDHPYARVSTRTVARSLDWLREHAPGLGYVGSLDENLLLPTAVGVAKPSALVPASMASGDLRAGGRFVFVGLRALKDFHPAYLAENLRQAKLPSGAALDARAVQLSDPGREADVNPLAYARLFERADFRRAVVAELGPLLETGEVVGFPSVLGRDHHAEVRAELADGLGHEVFEVPSLPPSLSGIRLFEALQGAFRRAGGRLVLGSAATGIETGSDGAAKTLVVRSAANRPAGFDARWFVLATGGFGSGAIELDSYGEVRETVMGLPVAGVPAIDRPRFLPASLGDHPMARAGLAVDDRLRPVAADGRPAFDNVVAAGAVLGGAQPWREQSGNGLALATGFAAATQILEGAS